MPLKRHCSPTRVGYFSRRINAECRAAGSANAAKRANLLLFALAETHNLAGGINSTHLLAKYKRIRWVQKTFSLKWGREGFSLEEDRKTLLRLEGNELRQALAEAVETS